MIGYLVCLSVILGVTTPASIGPEEVFSWKQVYFQWPNEQTEQYAIRRGTYIPENNMPLGIARWKEKLFITVPRWKRGVASPLNYIDIRRAGIDKSPLLIPYPSWKANTLPQRGETPRQDLIVSPFRMEVDVCDRLWIMDTGADDIFNNQSQIINNTIHIYDLNTDKLIRKYVLKPTDLIDGTSFFANIRVDVLPDDCGRAFAYIADLGGNAMVVYSFQENDSWRITHHFFNFDPLMGNLTVGGINFHWNDGLFGIALGPLKLNGERTVFFHALSSIREFSVSNTVLKNRTAARDANNYDLFTYEGNRGQHSQSLVSVFDEFANVIFFTQANKDGIACWNPNYRLNTLNFPLIAQDHEQLEFINDMVIDADRYLWMLSDRMPRFLFSSLNPNAVNFRIMRINVDEAVKDTACE